MTRTVSRGLLAGAAGTTVLDALGYLDMAVRGRPASTLPAQTIDALGDALGVTAQVPADVRESRHSGMGALAGIGAGLAVGVAASAARRWGFRPPRALGALTVAAAAMAATDGPAAALGVTDPRSWTAADWLSDAVPHLGYGLAVDAVLRRDPTPETSSPAGPAPASLVLRSALLGIAAGSRSSLGVAAPLVSTPAGAGLPGALTGRAAGALAAVAVGAELVGDKLPQTPSRLQPPVLAARLASGATGAAALSRRQQARPAAPVVAGVVGAAVGSFGGFAWREWAGQRVPDVQAALVEDAVAILLALAATLPGRSWSAPAEPPGPVPRPEGAERAERPRRLGRAGRRERADRTDRPLRREARLTLPVRLPGGRARPSAPLRERRRWF